ncbi:MAG: ACT domain-containing protein [Myxococcota bacterium]
MTSAVDLHADADARTCFLIELEDAPGALESVLREFTSGGINLTHIESRPSRGRTFDFYIDCEGRLGDPKIDAVVARLSQTTPSLLVLDDKRVPWFPRQGADLDRIANVTLDAGTDLESDHPGFSDPVYRQQRARIDELARAFRHGDDMPVIEYTDEEQQTWRTVYERLGDLRERHACRVYLDIFETLQRESGLSADRIPEGREISRFLEARTGFRLRPVAGLLSARHFLNALAFRVLFSTQYIRHHSKPLYTPEPDICHELLGHAPMFGDPAFADLSQEIGLASLGASDEDIERLARCYWFSVEFGLVREQGEHKAYGAGLLSSFGELIYACTGRDPDTGDTPEYLPWEPEVAAEQDYPITKYQPRYFVAPSLQDATTRMKAFCQSLSRPFYARYQPLTDRIWVDRAVRRED